MALVHEKPQSSESLLISDGDSDIESQIPQPEPLGSSKALTSNYHKWWWRKKNVVVKGSPKRKDRTLQSPTTASDGRMTLVLVLLSLIVLTTVITVLFHDSELVLALVTALALAALALLYYVNCCSFSSDKKKDLPQLDVPLSLASELSSDERKTPEPILMAQVPLTKHLPHRRDWSLPTMSTAFLSHRRPSTPMAPAHSVQLIPHSAVSIPQYYEQKLRVEFSLSDPLRSRIEYVSNALKQLAGSGSALNEARLSDAITSALTSCVRRSTLLQVKVSLDKLFRLENASERCSSLHAVVFSLMQKGERDAVLTHFSALQHVGTADDDESSSKKMRVVISDIDDTLVPTFKDRRGFAWGVPYPGVRRLYEELVSMEDEEYNVLKERVAFVTARPGILRNWTKQEIAKAGFGGSLILMGFATTATSPQGMLTQKVKQVREIKSLWPECSVVLVGDNGQRDIDLGTLLLKEGLVEAVFIHDIFASKEEFTRTTSTSFSEESDTIGAMDFAFTSSYYKNDEEEAQGLSEEDRIEAVRPKSMVRLVSAPAALGSLSVLSDKKRVTVAEPSIPAGFRHAECVEAGIGLFQTYAGAALQCYQKGLINVHAMERVTRSCATDIGLTSVDGIVKQRLVDSLLRDVARVALEFREKSPAEKVEFLEFIHEAVKKRSV